jgi:hypothetical protein
LSHRVLGIAVLLAAMLCVAVPAAAKQPEQREVELFTDDPPGLQGGLTVCIGGRFIRCHLTPRADAREFFFIGRSEGPDGSDDALYRSTRQGTEVVSTGPAGTAYDLGPCRRSEANCAVEIREDGSVVFVTRTALVGQDADGYLDVYLRKDGTTTLLSDVPRIGEAFNFGLERAAPDLSRMLFLVTGSVNDGEDDDFVGYIERAPGGVYSRFPADVPLRHFAHFHWELSSPDLSRIRFSSDARLTPDAKPFGGRYERGADGVLRFLHQPATGYIGSSDDGREFFRTGENLLPDDTDPCDASVGSCAPDIYSFKDGVLRLETPGTAREFGFQGFSQDGTRLWLQSDEPLAPEREEQCEDRRGGGVSVLYDCYDVYEYSNGVAKLISIGTSRDDANMVGASADGRRVFFQTAAVLDPSDTDSCPREIDGVLVELGCRDTFENFDGVVRRATPDPLDSQADSEVSTDQVTPEGALLFFSRERRSVDAPAGGGEYRWFDGTLRFEPFIGAVAAARLPADADVHGTSADGSRVFFSTNAALTPQDTDAGMCPGRSAPDHSCPDLYELHGGRFTLISWSPTLSDQGCGSFEGSRSCPRFVDVSADGTRVLFSTRESHVPSDTDGGLDVYLSRVVKQPCVGKPAGKGPKQCVG